MIEPSARRAPAQLSNGSSARPAQLGENGPRIDAHVRHGAAAGRQRRGHGTGSAAGGQHGQQETGHRPGRGRDLRASLGLGPAGRPYPAEPGGGGASARRRPPGPARWPGWPGHGGGGPISAAASAGLRPPARPARPGRPWRPAAAGGAAAEPGPQRLADQRAHRRLACAQSLAGMRSARRPSRRCPAFLFLARPRRDSVRYPELGQRIAEPHAELSRARELWLLTFPVEQPSMAATWSTLRSSQ